MDVEKPHTVYTTVRYEMHPWIHVVWSIEDDLKTLLKNDQFKSIKIVTVYKFNNYIHKRKISISSGYRSIDLRQLKDVFD